MLVCITREVLSSGSDDRVVFMYLRIVRVVIINQSEARLGTTDQLQVGISTTRTTLCSCIWEDQNKWFDIDWRTEQTIISNLVFCSHNLMY